MQRTLPKNITQSYTNKYNMYWNFSAITGGDKTSIDRFPHTVHIRHFNRSMCGGAVINTRFILTAAHCTDE